MNKKMKICFLTAGGYPVPATEGGAVENLTEMMLENYQLGEYDFSVDIISKKAKSAVLKSSEYTKTNFHFIHISEISMRIYSFARRVFRKVLKKDPGLLNPYFRKALRIIRKAKYDVVISENKVQYIKPLKKFTKSKVVLHLHNDYLNENLHESEKILKCADLVIAVSDYIKGRVLTVSGCDAPVVTVKNVIDLERFKKSEEAEEKAREIRRKHNFKEDDIVCIFTGRLIADKGVHLLCDAVNKIDNDKIKLLIVGGSSYADSEMTKYEESLRKRVSALKGRTVFTGYVDYADIHAYYRACDIAVFPSKWNEPAGLVVVEAQGCGLPVIISKSGGMPEYVCDDSAVIIERGQNFADELKKVIEKLAESDELRRKMGSAGTEYVKNFDKENYLDKIINPIMEHIYGIEN